MKQSHWTRRHFMGSAACAASLAAPGLASATGIPAQEIEAYFNGLKEGSARFTQLNADGSRSSGVFYIRRPGRMRFEYDGPKGSILIAGNSRLAIIEDPSRNSAVKIYPLNQTPLWLLLRRNVELTSSKFALGLRHTEAASVLTVHDPDKPNYGQMQLVFTPNPTTLRQWVTTTPQGERTTVILGPIDTRTKLDRALFDIPGLDDDN